jgi:phosphate transport system permease protein
VTDVPHVPVGRRILANRLFLAVCVVCTGLAVCVLAVLIVSIVMDGVHRLSPDFIANFASRKPQEAGIRAPLVGSIWVCAICALTALPIGVGTAIYLEEFAKRGKFTEFIRINISNLSGVPSVVYGIIGLTAFSRFFGWRAGAAPIALGNPDSMLYLQLPFGSGVLAGGLTLALVVLPIVIVASQEAIRAVPNSLRQGSLALGSTRWQMVSQITLPASLPMIMTGAILAMSRAIGEAAPILVLGAPLLVLETPTNLMSDFTVLPMQVFNWMKRSKASFQEIAAAAIIVQLAVLMSFNAFAIIVRHRLQRPLQ